MPDGPQPIRIVIADDHPIFRDGLRRLLELEPGMTVVGEAGTGEQATERVAELRPDILLLDLAMPRSGGLGVLQELAERGDPVRVIVVTAAVDREDVIRALRLGARGLLLKESATKMLYSCVRSVMKGESWIAHQQISDLVKSLQESAQQGAGRAGTPAALLTRRELQVIAAVIDGASNKDIGERFNLSEQTVKNHLTNIFDKLGVSNRLELALYAIHHKLPGTGGDRKSS